MKNKKEKLLNILLVLVIVFGVSSISFKNINLQNANVISFIFSSSNTNETVLKAQEKLEELGLYDGNKLGLFGLKTRSAIYTFQEMNGLTQNGILDIPTQRALFNTKIEYIKVSYTDIGNTFLRDWIRYFYNAETKNIKLSGKLTLKIQAGEPNSFVLTVEDAQYNIINISDNSLSDFVDKNITINGVFLANEGVSIDDVFINYTDEETEYPVFISYTEYGNEYLSEWINNTYGEEGEYITKQGEIVFGGKVKYSRNGKPTNVYLVTDEGEEFAVENISQNNLGEFVNKKVILKGMVLNEFNSLGLRTIVINYDFQI